VSALIGDRFYPVRLPDKDEDDVPLELPACRFFRVSSDPTYSHDGDSNLTEDGIQIDVYAASYSEAEQTADALQTALSGVPFTVDNVQISSCFKRNRQQSFEDALQRWRAILDFDFKFTLL
jgi:hypothetical protein